MELNEGTDKLTGNGVSLIEVVFN